MFNFEESEKVSLDISQIGEYKKCEGIATNGEEIKNVDLIEITNLPAKNLLLESTDEFLSEGIEIESRFILYNEKYDYSEWTEKEKITTFDFEEIPTPSITDLKSDLTYNLENEEEISDFFQVFSKINEKEITYKTEYKFNDQTWKEEKEEFDTNDAKVEVRIKYQIGEYESKYSNVLVYEKHPEKVCPFDSDICCNEFANISLCYWLIIIFFVITGLIILIERKKRLKREA